MFIVLLTFLTTLFADLLHSGTDEPVANVFYGGTLTVISVHVITM